MISVSYKSRRPLAAAFCTIMVLAILSTHASFASVSKISGGCRGYCQWPAKHIPFFPDIDWDREYPISGIEGEPSRTKDIAAYRFVCDTSSEHRGYKECSPSFVWLSWYIARGQPFFDKFIPSGFVLSVPLSINISNAVAERCGFSNAVDNFSLARQYGITIASQNTAIFVNGLRSAKPSHCIGVEFIKELKDKRRFYINCSGGRVSEVCDLVSGKSRDPGSNWELLDAGDRQAVNQQPRPLSQRHLIQLPLHDLCLVTHDAELVIYGSIVAPARDLHFGKLQYRSEEQRSGESSDNARPMDHLTIKFALGTFGIAAGFGCFLLSVWTFGYWYETRGWWIVCAGSFFAGIVLTYQSAFLVFL